jgi:RNA polymerase primary sigma factor
LNREPTIEDIAERMDLSVPKVRTILIAAREPIILGSYTDEDQDSCSIYLIADNDLISPEETIESLDLSAQISSALAALKPREEKILRMRFGIGKYPEHTLEEVGQDYALTRERIRQIEAKALRKLRHPARRKELKNFIST